jgi:hypothetical protein
LGALVAILLALWLAPSHYPAPDALTRAWRGGWLMAVWAAPLTLGLSLVEGQFRRAAGPWARRAAVAAGLAALLGAVGGAGASYWPATWWWHDGALLLSPLPAGIALGLATGAAFALGFRRERHGWQTLLTGLLLGAALGAVWHAYLSEIVGLPGLIGHMAFHAGALLPAGVVLGFGHGVTRELCKRAWLLVVFGDQPGWVYPLYGTAFTVGTAVDNRLVIDAAGGVFPRHVTIWRQHACGAVEASNPDALVFLHDSRIDVGEVYDGDELQIGETVLRYGVIS